MPDAPQRVAQILQISVQENSSLSCLKGMHLSSTATDVLLFVVNLSRFSCWEAS